MLHGEALDNAETVFFNGRKGSLVNGDASSSRGAKIPAANPAEAGPISLLVTGPFGHSELAPAAAYVTGDKLAFFGVSPANGPASGGAEVQILVDLAGATAKSVSFGDKSVALKGGKLSVKTPAHTPGPVDLTLVTSQGSKIIAAGYTFWEKPKVSKISPASGPAAGGQLVSLSGTGLAEGCTVRFGTWLAQMVVGSGKGTSIDVTSPPGSPGPVDLTITCGAEVLVVPAGYTYDNGKLRIDSLVPNKGATGGGTWVTLYGSGFDKQTQVFFDGKTAGSLTVEDAGTLTLKTPAHAPGSVAIDVVRGEQADTLIDGFTYFSPTNPHGGTYGGPLQGTLNVTVLNFYTLKPVAQAFVQVGQPGQANFPKYSGYTDDDGQIVFSGTDVQPPTTVSATKPQFSASSIANFEVGNATLLLFPWTPPSNGGGGGGGPGLPLATLKGRVLDIDKYMLMPPTTCLKPSEGGPICDFCETDKDCVDDSGKGKEWACVETGGVSARCFNTCQSDTDCQTDFTCGLDVVDGKRKVCRPSVGIREITCQTGTRGLDTENPDPGPGSKVDEKTGQYEITSRLDELAIYCIGGYRNNDGTFRKTAMGVRRHVFPQPGQTLDGLDIQLNIPLQRTLPVRLDHPQSYFPSGNGGDLTLQGWLHLGSDGYVPLAEIVSKAEKQGETGVFSSLEIPEQPLTFPAEMTDTTFTWRAVVDYGKGGTAAPMEAGTLHAGVVRPGDDNMLVIEGGSWVEQQVGIHTTLIAALPGAATDVLLAAKDGRIFRGSGEDLYAVWLPPIGDPYAQPAVVLGAAGTPTDATLVGEDGLIRRLVSGPKGPVVTVEKSPSDEHLTAVCHGSKARVIVGDKGIVLVSLQPKTPSGADKDGEKAGPWLLVPSGTSTNLRGVACTQSGAVAVGQDGAVVTVDLTGGAPKAAAAKVNGELSGVALGPTGALWIAGRTKEGWGLLLTSTTGNTWKSGWPAGTKASEIPGMRRIAIVTAGTVLLADEDGGIWRRTAAGLTDESPQRRNVLPMAIAVDTSGGARVVGEPGLWLGPFLTMPTVTSPGDLVTAKQLKVEWAVADGPAASVSRVHIDGQGFPFWWLYIDPISTSVSLPDFVALSKITVFPPMEVPFIARVDRIFAPDISINGFSTFELEFGKWRSWSTNGKAFKFNQ